MQSEEWLVHSGRCTKPPANVPPDALWRDYNLGVSCDHLSHFVEVREGRTIILCEACRVELVGWRIEISLPFFLLEQADDAHVMYHLSRERRESQSQTPEGS